MVAVETYWNMGPLAVHSYLLDGLRVAVEAVVVASNPFQFLALSSPFWQEDSGKSKNIVHFNCIAFWCASNRANIGNKLVVAPFKFN